MSTPLTGDRTFRNDPVRLADLTVNTPVIEGYEFINCRILGPAVIVPQGDTSIVRCSWDAPDFAAIFWEITPDRPYIVGAIAVVNCTFSNCRFEGVGIAGNREAREQMEKGFGARP